MAAQVDRISSRPQTAGAITCPRCFALFSNNVYKPEVLGCLNFSRLALASLRPPGNWRLSAPAENSPGLVLRARLPKTCRSVARRSCPDSTTGLSIESLEKSVESTNCRSRLSRPTLSQLSAMGNGIRAQTSKRALRLLGLPRHPSRRPYSRRPSGRLIRSATGSIRASFVLISSRAVLGSV